MDRFIAAYIKTNVHVDAGQRVFCKGVELKVHMVGNEQKVVLPISKQTFTFKDLKLAGAKVDATVYKTLALAGAEGRWKDQIEARRDAGLPSNVYVANARSIQYAMEKDKPVPAATYIGRHRDKMTEVYPTVDEVVEAMSLNKWRTEFARGRHAKRKTAK